MVRIAIAVAFAVLASARVAAAEAVVDRLTADDPALVRAAVAEVEATPAGAPDLADAVFAAARACEDTLHEPARALALYDRIARELPDARVAIAAARRATALRAQLGARGEHAAEATALAHLIADADGLAADAVIRRGDALATAAWPGAPEAGLWLAEWLRRTGRLAEADARFRDVAARWPGTPYAERAIRGAASTAIERHDWDRAEALARELPVIEPADQVTRDDLLDAAARGRRRARWYVLAWLVAGAAVAVLAGSLVEASVAGGRRRPQLVPGELTFLAPVAAVLIGVALTTHPLIAPAVATLAIGGLVLAWLSGSALDTARARGRPIRARAALHAVVAVLAVAALCYVALTRDGLLDLMIETVRSGPEPA